ncbi:MAG: hypothetical protein LBP24_02905, partial [Coriobacteriales bacterium]|nr:hypothetical protein [Coriobacteriales bacterium]
NDYQPADGGIVMGDLEFSYKGDGAEQVVLQEIRLHTKDADDVDTQTLNPGTVYSVTRASDTGGSGSGGDDDGSGSGEGSGGSGSGGGEGSGTGGGTGGGGGEGSGSGGGSGGGSGSGGTGTGGGSGSGSGSGGGDGGWGTITDNDGSGLLDGNGNPVVELTPDPSTGTSGSTVAPGSSGTGGTALGDATTPLTATSPAGDKAQLPLGWFLGGAAVLALIALVGVILWRRRRQNQEGLQDDR